MSIFLVDSNFFIQAHRAHYPLDVVPSFWKKILQLATEGKLVSIDKVKAEIYQNKDALKDWCQDNLPNDFFKSSDISLTEYAQIANWANSRSNHYKPTALAEFLHADEADAWLVAYALNQNIPLITHEKSEPNSKKKIKIPDVCIPFGVDYCTTIDMFRRLEEQF
ncbi:MAG: DUF4411 family protein [Bacteroidota bacterium]